MSEVLSLDAIEVSPTNLRQQFDQEELLVLAQSILQCGVLQPVLVTPLPESPRRFQLIAGERRWRASKLAKCSTIPAIIVNGDAPL